MSPAKRRRIAGESGPTASAKAEVPNDSAVEPEVEDVTVEEVAVEETEAPEAVEEMLEPEMVEAPVEDAPEDVVEEPAPPKKPAVPTAKKKPAAADIASVDAGERRPGSWQILVAGLVAFALLGVGIFAVWRGVDKATDEPSTRAARDAAGIGIETIFTYNFQNLDAHRDESVKLMTSKYKQEFEKILPTLDESAPQREVVAQAVIRGIATMPCGKDCSADKTTLLVFYDQARLADGAKSPTVFGQRVTVELVKDDDRWLINDIGAL